MPAFQGLAIAPQFEKISLDQYQLSFFLSLHNFPPRSVLPLMKPRFLTAIRVFE